MTFTISEIAAALGAECAGEVDIRVMRASEPSVAQQGDLALAMDRSYVDALSQGNAVAAVLWPGADWQAMGLKAAIFVNRPRFAMAGITAKFDRLPEIAQGIHETAVINPTADIGAGVSVGAFTVIGARAKIGMNSQIMSQVTIAEDAELGGDALVYSGVRIGSSVQIGARFIAHYNSVVGSDGFSFVTPEPSGAEEARRDFKTSGKVKHQAYARIASNASVVIGDDVELGASATIDKGTIASTQIGSGSKIDNHVQVGHNVKIGEHCLLCAHAAVAGSTVLGDRVILGGQAGVGDHLVLGDDVIAAGATAILSNVPAGRVMMGYPAMKMETNIEAYKALRRLPRLVAKFGDLQKQVSRLIDKS
ncbi:MAG: UDP-3-O-[3-hydroxymyristoyl] glucosamine N-acyltransferase [Paracoccaceae bacterium]|jgi:UDP-3-O-[3-hydroxymyristoyl] glucosamine N-acyltransferase